MGKVYESIDSKIQAWISKQHMFFVATSPRSDEGQVNLSPKGNDTLRVLDESTLAFMDTGGSGIETIAHIRENGRIVIMMCAFEGLPKIFRFHGRGHVVTPLDTEFTALAARFDRTALGIRAIVHIDVQRVSDSCGFGVPLYDYKCQRTTSQDYLRNTPIDKVRKHMFKNNEHNVDGLPGISEEEANAFDVSKFAR